MLRPIRLLNFRLLIISSVVTSVTWVISFHTKAIQDPVYFYNSRLGLDVCGPFAFVVLSLEIAVRHTVSKCARDFWLNLYELISLLIENSLGLYYTIAVTSAVDDQVNTRYQLLVFTYVMMSCLGTSLLFLIWDLLWDEGTTILKPFRVLGNIPPRSRPSVRSLFFGRSLFARRYKREGTALRRLRGITAGAMLVGFGIIMCFALIFQPFENQGPSLVKEFKESYQTLESQGLLSYPGWNINIRNAFDFSQLLSQPEFIQVNWTSSNNKTDLQRCQNINSHMADVVSYTCPTLFSLGYNNSSLDKNTSEIVISVDFTNGQNDVPGLWGGGVYVDIGFSTNDNSGQAIPIPLVPGSHLIGFTSILFTQEYVSAGLAVLGWGVYSRLTPVAIIGALIPDPLFSEQKSSDSATLRLVPMQKNMPNAKYKILRDDKENSMLSGFALLGGLWTFLNGAFSIVFGCTLLLILFGIKPLSIYGIAHFLSEKNNSLAEGLTMSPDEQQRIIAILHQHLMDVGSPDDNHTPVRDIESGARRSCETVRSLLSYASIQQHDERGAHVDAEPHIEDRTTVADHEVVEGPNSENSS